MDQIRSYLSGKKVLLTGHTGFKGSWMSEWLLSLGADVVGVGLEPDTEPSLFEQLGLADRLDHRILDIREREALVNLVVETRPDVVFHLAAQPLVRYSYLHPTETFATNVMGTVHLLEGLSQLDGPCEVVVVTTDKCYENHEKTEPYNEEDPMGGRDPYSASKGAVELVTASWRRSFFDPESYGISHGIAIATARAGNVIGGGDWAEDRILPDAIRAISAGMPVAVRNPEAVRPWQHVLEPLSGYMTLAYRLGRAGSIDQRNDLFSSFNFGPETSSARSVRELMDKVLSSWPGTWFHESGGDSLHEARFLTLAIEKAERLLGWKPVWTFDRAVEETVGWYRAVDMQPKIAREIAQAQLAAYSGQ